MLPQRRADDKGATSLGHVPNTKLLGPWISRCIDVCNAQKLALLQARLAQRLTLDVTSVGGMQIACSYMILSHHEH